MKQITLFFIISLSQALVIGWLLGLGIISVVVFGMFIGTVLGTIVFVSYSEIKLLIEDLDKIDVSGKSVLITGCDSGFGLKLAESLTKKGVFVFAGVLNLSSVGAENLKGFPSIKVIKMDVTKEDEVEEAYKVVDQHIKKTKMILWAIVNNAGICNSQMLPFVPIIKMREILEVNTLGLLRVTQRFTLLLRGHGRIVNLTSIAGTMPVPLFGTYCASKFASEAISRTLRIELGPLGISVITIQPGGYQTNIITNMNILFDDETENLYGKQFIEECQANWKRVQKRVNPNIGEVTSCIESAILNKKFQYNYNPNFKLRLFILFSKYFYDHSNESNYSSMKPLRKIN